MSQEKIVSFNGKKINYGKLTDESLIRLYTNMRNKEISLYKKIIKYEKDLGLAEVEKFNNIG